MLEISLINSRQHLQVLHYAGDLLIGSADAGQAAVTSLRVNSPANSLVIDDARVADQQATLREIEFDDRRLLEVENFGQSIMLADGRRVHCGETLRETLPVKFWIGSTCFHVADANTEDAEFDKQIHTLPRAGQQADASVEPTDIAIDGRRIAPAAQTLHQWFESLGRLHRSIAGTSEFFADAAHAVFDPGGLDVGMVLTLENNDWTIVGSFVPDPDCGFSFRRSVLNRMLETGQTVFHHPSQRDQGKVEDVVVAVASPIFDEQNQIVGAIHGLRRHHSRNNRLGVRPLEAQFVQLLADSLTAGMVRLQREAEVARTQVMFEQVFSPTVARELQRNPRILDGHEREVTILFADLQGFTSVSEKLGSKATYQMLGDVMNCLSEHVADQDGVIIDYFGDGLAAFWNAPIDQPQHALLACQAAIAMQTGFAEVRNDWSGLVGHPMQLGIGIHTGSALIGNSGSSRRLKYGPRGTAVNIASRIENATRQFNAPILVSAPTAAAVGGSLPTRRVFKCALKGIGQPIELFQIFDASITAKEREAVQIYERALASFESGDHATATEILSTCAGLHHDPVASCLVDRINAIDRSAESNSGKRDARPV